MAASNIEWTDATWNPTVGCSKVSPGCKHCYALTMHARLTKMGQAKYAEPFETVRPWPAQLADPLSWRKPRRVFVNSMSDLFHDDVPDEYIAAVFGVMAAAPKHTFQVLTKRAARMARWFRWISGQPMYAPGQEAAVCVGHVDGVEIPGGPESQPWPLPNVWLGVSAENQERADERVPDLLRTPAAVRFVSYEPALEAVDFFSVDGSIAQAMARLNPSETRFPADVIDWLIVGGESGPGARPFDVAWARSAVEQCRAAGVACFVKQLGTNPISDALEAGRVFKMRADGSHSADVHLESKKGGDMSEWPADLRVRQFPEMRP